MTDQRRYLHRLLDRYRSLPGTLGRVLRDDRHTALALYRRRIDLDVIDQAFVLGIARRAFSDTSHPHEPIRTLRYFLPLIAEILDSPPDPAYLHALQRRLRGAGLLPSA
jgi:hypothetical protein